MGCELIINHCKPSTSPRSWYHFLVRCPIGGYQSPLSVAGLLGQTLREAADSGGLKVACPLRKPKIVGEVGDITRIQICIDTHGQKRLISALSGVDQKSIGGNRPALPQSLTAEEYETVLRASG
ncbi:hypothetical protein TNCV_2867561 [Trichonephila clavipes]|nr:hypothetical protein TNCV_2867561 [Trichonephila clavipes]